MLTMLTIITAVKLNYNVLFQNQILQQQAALTTLVLVLLLKNQLQIALIDLRELYSKKF